MSTPWGCILAVQDVCQRSDSCKALVPSCSCTSPYTPPAPARSWAAQDPSRSCNAGITRRSSCSAKVLIAAAAGLEGEAAVVALALGMLREGLTPHQALVAASAQHAALHVRAPTPSAFTEAPP